MSMNVVLVRWYVANLAKSVYRIIILVRRCVMLLQLARRRVLVLPRSRLLVHVETDDRRFHARIRSNVLHATKTAVRKRNEKLAEAFGISREKREEMAAGPKAIWSDELIDFYARANANAKFVRLMEDTLAEFVKSSRRTQVLQYMTAERRKFVQGFASVYRVDTTEVDQEPRRSVQLIRRIDTRIPVPLLSQSATSAASSSKLVDLRSSKASLRGTGGLSCPRLLPVRRLLRLCTPSSQITPAWKMPSSSSSSSRNTPPPYVANKYDASSSGRLPPHLSGPSPPSYATLQSQAQRERPVAVAREDVPENWEDDA
ncbi:hypothetical protein EDD15DRAFT_2364539 [Pisolithus albus]|nr:hypothetical protein EDD15DRAFT_2364539 [Pisolithus albus]